MAEMISPGKADLRGTLPARFILITALTGLLALAALIISPFVAPLVLALTLTAIGHPFFQWLLRKVGPARRGLASLIACTAIVIVIVLPLVWIAYSVAREAEAGLHVATGALVDFTKRLESTEWFRKIEKNPGFQSFWSRIRSSRDTIERVEGGPGAGTSGMDRPPPPPGANPPGGAAGSPAAPAPGAPAAAGGEGFDPLTWVTHTISGLLTNTISVLFKFGLMVFTLFYFFKDGPQILRSLKRAMPIEERYLNEVIEVFRQLSHSVIWGSFGTAVAQGLVAGLAFLVIGLPPVVWGALVAFASLIPPFGTGLVTVPVTVALLLGGHWAAGIFMGFIAAVIVVVMDFMLRPWLTGRNLTLHNLWLLISILGAMEYFGPMGLVYGPMVLVFLGTSIALFVREEWQATAGTLVRVAPPGTAVPPPASGPPPSGGGSGPVHL